MALLTDKQRFAAWADLMRAMSIVGESCALTKHELRAMLDKADEAIHTEGIKNESEITKIDFSTEDAKTLTKSHDTSAIKERTLKTLLATRAKLEAEVVTDAK